MNCLSLSLQSQNSYRRNLSRNLYQIAIAAICFLVSPSLCFSQVIFEVQPTEILLGQFSAADPIQNGLLPGETTVSIQYSEPWDLFVTLQEPVRRLSDGLELPLDRIQEIFSDVPPQFANYAPARFDYGPGSAELQEWRYNWQLVQMRLVEFLEQSDPPGIFRTILRLELLARDGAPLADPIQVVFEFEILPWVQISLPGYDLICNVSDEGIAFSEPYPVHVRSNAQWDMHVTSSENLIDTENGRPAELSRLSWMIWQDADWESMLPDFVPVSTSPQHAAHGNSPLPFTIFDAEIPIQIQFDNTGFLYSGNFGSDFMFSIHCGEDAQ